MGCSGAMVTETGEPQNAAATYAGCNQENAVGLMYENYESDTYTHTYMCMCVNIYYLCMCV